MCWQDSAGPWGECNGPASPCVSGSERRNNARLKGGNKGIKQRALILELTQCAVSALRAEYNGFQFNTFFC